MAKMPKRDEGEQRNQPAPQGETLGKMDRKGPDGQPGETAAEYRAQHGGDERLAQERRNDQDGPSDRDQSDQEQAKQQGGSDNSRTYEIELNQNQPVHDKMTQLRKATPGIEYEVLDERDGKVKVKVTGDETALRKFDERMHGG